MTSMRLLSVVLLFGSTAACGAGDPADVAGNYTMAITNRENGCMIQNWTVGNQTTGVQVTVTQQDENVTAVVEGAAGFVYNAWLGDDTFRGTVSGSTVDLEILGSQSYMMGNCTYTYNALLDANADGDSLSGRIIYTAATNDNPDCTTLDGCSSLQEFSGVRPPPP